MLTGRIYKTLFKFSLACQININIYKRICMRIKFGGFVRKCTSVDTVSVIVSSRGKKLLAKRDADRTKTFLSIINPINILSARRQEMLNFLC
jgi:hypothetical protein